MSNPPRYPLTLLHKRGSQKYIFRIEWCPNGSVSIYPMLMKLQEMVADDDLEFNWFDLDAVQTDMVEMFRKVQNMWGEQ